MGPLAFGQHQTHDKELPQALWHQIKEGGTVQAAREPGSGFLVVLQAAIPPTAQSVEGR